MTLDLDLIHRHASGLGLKVARTSPYVVAVTLKPNVILEFVNLVSEDDDNLIGFKDTPWHTHDSLPLMIGKGVYTELSACEVLTAIRAGDVIVFEEFLENKLSDRWIAGKLEPLDIQHIESGEELRIFRV